MQQIVLPAALLWSKVVLLKKCIFARVTKKQLQSFHFGRESCLHMPTDFWSYQVTKNNCVKILQDTTLIPKPSNTRQMGVLKVPELGGPVAKVPLARVAQRIKVPLRKGPCSYRQFGEHPVGLREFSIPGHNKQILKMHLPRV